MATTPKLKRKFFLLDEEGRNLDVVAQIRDSGTGNYFSVGSQHGFFKRDPASLPEAVRDDLHKLMALHLAGEDGSPMHAFLNATYHLQNLRFTDAAESLGVPGNARDLINIYADVEAMVTDKGPENPVRVRLEAIKKATAAVKAARAKFAKAKSEDVGLYGRAGLACAQAEDNYLRAAIAYDRMRQTGDDVSREKPTGTRLEKQKQIDRFERVYRWIKDDRISLDVLNSEIEGEVKENVRKRLLAQAVRDYVERVCRPLWQEAAVEGRRLLSLPDFRDDRRPDPNVDPRTFKGFLAANGVSFDAKKVGQSSHPTFKGLIEWSCTFSANDGRVYALPFFSNDPLTADVVLEHLQSQSASTMGYDDRDQWIKDLGYDDGIESVRKGEREFDEIIRNDAAMRAFFGETAYTSLMTEVGDNPPLRVEDFQEDQTSPSP